MSYDQHTWRRTPATYDREADGGTLSWTLTPEQGEAGAGAERVWASCAPRDAAGTGITLLLQLLLLLPPAASSSSCPKPRSAAALLCLPCRQCVVCLFRAVPY